MSSSCRVATSHGLCRGWFTYGDLCTLLDNSGFLRTLGIFRLEVLKVSASFNIFRFRLSQNPSRFFVLTFSHLGFECLEIVFVPSLAFSA